jgi:membrane protein involved in colicin uptake
MPEEIFLGDFTQYCRANPRESFEALRPKYEAIQERLRARNEITRAAYLRRLEADKAQKQRERKQAAEQAALEREAEVKRQFRYRYATLSEAQYDAFWPDIYKEVLLAESNRREAEMRRDYQF